ncbi:MAG: HAMP domain-containing histidine kinase [Lachnospiraceae bacterium]|nr:HAMP domain-containing histidine kinase [Lachnospiraceae bacterium]
MFENKTIAKLEQMLDDAIDGKFVETDYDESRLSRLESKWKDFLGSSVLSNENLEKERKRLETFISDISHQTKTPMTNIKMYTELLLEETSRDSEASIEKIQKYAHEISKQNSRLEFLIDSLTKLSRLENGILAVEAREEEVDKLITTSIAAVSAKASLKNIKISHKKFPSLKAFFDLKWTNEALINILDNAVKYTPDGGSVEVFSEKFEMYSAIHVVDDGPGISEEEMAKVFGRFYRGSDFQQDEGVGIGLYLTREIIEKEDGYIKAVANNKRSGGELIVYLRNKS